MVIARRGSFSCSIASSTYDEAGIRRRLHPYFMVSSTAETADPPPGKRFLIEISDSWSEVDADFVWHTDFWSVSRVGNHFFVKSSDGRGVFRLVRELWKIHSWSRGAVFVHSAAVVVDGWAWLLVGHRRGGKTSTMLRMVSAGAEFLSNDDAVVRRQGSDLMVEGSDRRINVRREAYGFLEGGLTRSLLDAIVRSPATGEGWSLSVDDLVDAGAARVQSGRLGGIVRVELDDAKPKLVKLRGGLSWVEDHVQAIPDDLNSFLLYESPLRSLGDTLRDIRCLREVPQYHLTGAFDSGELLVNRFGSLNGSVVAHPADER